MHDDTIRSVSEIDRDASRAVLLATIVLLSTVVGFVSPAAAVAGGTDSGSEMALDAGGMRVDANASDTSTMERNGLIVGREPISRSAALTVGTGGRARSGSGPLADANRTEVTLITGQTVTVIETANRTYYRTDAGTTMRTVRYNGTAYVFPASVDFSTFDPMLFNIGLLRTQNLTDAESDSIPLIVRQSGSDDSVRTKRESGDGSLSTLHEAEGYRVRQSLGSIDSEAGVASKRNARRVYDSLRSDGDVAHVSLDVKYRVALDEAGETVDAGTARRDWSVSGEGVTVAVVDSGVDEDHPDLPAEVSERDFTDENDPEAVDDNGHGTHVAGIVAGDGTDSNGTYVGIAPNASIIDARVLGPDGYGYTSDIVAGMNWSVDKGADVISMSLGGPTFLHRSNDPYREAVGYASDNNVTVVVSAGNDGGSGFETVGSPGVLKEVITVGASDGTGAIADFSSRGPTPGGYVKPDLVAPGVAVKSTCARSDCYGSGYTNKSGTSMAAPVVSGVSALLLEEYPGWTPARVKNVLQSTADPLNNTAYSSGTGRVNATAALGTQVYVGPGTTDFGPVWSGSNETRTISITNNGTDTRTFDLSASARSLVDAPGAVSLNRTNVTVAPGETAYVALTVSGTTELGVYSGRISIDNGTYRTAFGYVLGHELSVEKEGLNGTSVADDVALVTPSDPFNVSGPIVFRQFGSDGRFSVAVTDEGRYSVTSPGVYETDDQPVVSVASVTVDANMTTTLDEGNTSAVGVDVSALEAEHGALGTYATTVNYVNPSDRFRHIGTISVDSPNTTAIRVTPGEGVDLSVERVFLPESSEGDGAESFDSSVVIDSFQQVDDVSGDVTTTPDPDDFGRKDVEYYRANESNAYNATHETLVDAGGHLFVNTYGGPVGTRAEQTAYIDEAVIGHGVAVSGTYANGSEWFVDGYHFAAPNAGERVTESVNVHPYYGYSDLDVSRSDNDSYALYGVSPLLTYRGAPLFDGGNDDISLLYDGSVVASGAYADERVDVRPVDDGTTIELRTVKRTGFSQSTRVVTNVTVQYAGPNDDDASAPSVGYFSTMTNASDGSARIPRDNGGDIANGTVVASLLVTGESAENLTGNRVAWGTDTDTEPFAADGSLNAGWTEANLSVTDTEAYGVQYRVEYDTSGYSGPVDVAFRATDDANNSRVKTIYDAFETENFAPTVHVLTNATVEAPNSEVPEDGPTIYLNASETASLNASGSYDNFGIASVEWSFEGSEAASGTRTTVSYDAVGTYNASVTVTDAQGASRTENFTVVVDDFTPPTARLAANVTEADVYRNATVAFDASNSSDNGRIDHYEWDFDGNSSVNATTTSPTATTTYTEIGNYTATVTVVDEAGNDAVATRTVAVADRTPPTVNQTGLAADGNAVSVDNATVAANDTVSMTATVDGTPGNATGVELVLDATSVNFEYAVEATRADDGTWHATADLTAANVPDDGTYSVEVRATDVGGNANATTGSTAVTVDRGAPGVGATLNREDATTGRLNVTVDEAVDEAGVTASVTLPNGTTEAVPLTPTGSRYTGTFDLAESGSEYGVTASATDAAGNVGTASATATISTVSTDGNDTVTIRALTGAFIEVHTNESVTDSYVSLTGSDTALAPLAATLQGAGFLNGELGSDLDLSMNYALVGVPVDDANLPPGKSAEEVSIRHFNATTHEWESLETEELEKTVNGTTDTYWVANVSHFSTYGAVTEDTTPPEATDISHRGTLPWDTRDLTARVDYTDDIAGVNASAVQVYLTEPNGTETEVTDDARTSITSEYAAVDLDDLERGVPYEVRVRAVDEAGHARNITTEFTVAEDTAAPSVTVAADSVQGDETLPAGTTETTIAFDLADAVSGVNVSTVNLTVNGTPVTPDSVSASGVSYTLTGLSNNSTHTVNLTVSDRAGYHVLETFAFEVAAPGDDTDSSGAGGGGGGGGGGPDDGPPAKVSAVDTNDGATVNVQDIRMGADFAADVPGTSGAGVTVERLGFQFTFEADRFRVEVTDPTASPQGTPRLSSPGASALAYFRADAIQLESGKLDDLTLGVSADSLPEGVDPADVRLYRYHDGSWHALDTESLGDGTYEAGTTGFSAFAVGYETADDDTATTTVATTGTPTSASTSTGSRSTTTSTKTVMPGFGAIAALVALAGVAFVAFRRRD